MRNISLTCFIEALKQFLKECGRFSTVIQSCSILMIHSTILRSCNDFLKDCTHFSTVIRSLLFLYGPPPFLKVRNRNNEERELSCSYCDPETIFLKRCSK